MALRQGIDPDTFWRLTLGELGAMLGRSEEIDKARWVHTGNLLALQINQNRRKGSKSVSWQDVAPYDYSAPELAPTPVTREHFEQGKAWAANFKKS